GNPESRLEDKLRPESLLIPDTYPYYRRQVDRRRLDRREQFVSVAGNRRVISNRRSGERRRSRPVFLPEQGFVKKTVASLGSIFRDALIPYMPDAVVRQLVGKGEFVF